MKAVVYESYGGPDVLQVREVAEPQAAPGQARVRVHAAALNPKDVLVRMGKMWWLTRSSWPRTPGYDFAGVLLDAADGLEMGSEVYGMVQDHRGGTCAEMIAVPYDEIALKPPELTMAEAASLPLAGLTALQGLRDVLRVRPRERVLLNGASGGVGSLAVQIGQALGAHLTAVCSGRNSALVRELGASRVVDYATTALGDLGDFDAVFDIFGNFPWPRARRVLKPQGRYCTTVPTVGSVLRAVGHRLGVHRADLVVVRSRRADLDTLSGWVEGRMLQPVIDQVLPLRQSDRGHAHLETRRARGKVVISVRPEPARS